MALVRHPVPEAPATVLNNSKWLDEQKWLILDLGFPQQEDSFEGVVDKRTSSEPPFEHEWRVSVSRATSLQIKSIFPWRLVPPRNPNMTYYRESKGIHSSFFPMLSGLVKPKRWLWGFNLSLSSQNNDYLTCSCNWSRREISTSFDYHSPMLTVYPQI